MERKVSGGDRTQRADRGRNRQLSSNRCALFLTGNEEKNSAMRSIVH